MELRLLLVTALVACVPQAKHLAVPDSMMKATDRSAAAQPAASPQAAADPFRTNDPFASSATKTGAAKPAPLRAPATSATAPDQRYVLRLIEHGRTWEVELPEQTGGYEVRVPIGPPVEAPTLADQELLGKDPKGAPPRSYLSALARIAEMYSAHKYELALIEAADLGQQYPKEGRIEAMKGSLYQKLGKTELAREAWKKALELDPTDVTVAEALRGLKGE